MNLGICGVTLRTNGHSTIVPAPAKRLITSFDRAAELLETVVYAGVALALGAGSVVLLGQAIWSFVDHADEDVERAATGMLGTLLLVFVFVELLAAVRTTMRERRLVAEPFLLVGVIATIKELVVAGTEGGGDHGFAEVRDGILELGGLALVVLLLALAALLLRRREREPEETDRPV